MERDDWIFVLICIGSWFIPGCIVIALVMAGVIPEGGC